MKCFQLRTSREQPNLKQYSFEIPKILTDSHRAVRSKSSAGSGWVGESNEEDQEDAFQGVQYKIRPKSF